MILFNTPNIIYEIPNLNGDLLVGYNLLKGINAVIGLKNGFLSYKSKKKKINDANLSYDSFSEGQSALKCSYLIDLDSDDQSQTRSSLTKMHISDIDSTPSDNNRTKFIPKSIELISRAKKYGYLLVQINI